MSFKNSLKKCMDERYKRLINIAYRAIPYGAVKNPISSATMAEYMQQMAMDDTDMIVHFS